MGNSTLRFAIHTALTGGSLAASFGVANAQTATPPAAAGADASLQEVVVTGSRISVPNQVSISPVTFVSALDIQQTGVTRVEDLLNELPQVFAAQGSMLPTARTAPRPSICVAWAPSAPWCWSTAIAWDPAIL